MNRFLSKPAERPSVPAQAPQSSKGRKISLSKRAELDSDETKSQKPGSHFASPASNGNIDQLLKEFRKELDSIKSMDILQGKTRQSSPETYSSHSLSQPQSSQASQSIQSTQSTQAPQPIQSYHSTQNIQSTQLLQQPRAYSQPNYITQSLQSTSQPTTQSTIQNVSTFQPKQHSQLTQLSQGKLSSMDVQVEQSQSQSAQAHHIDYSRNNAQKLSTSNPIHNNAVSSFSNTYSSNLTNQATNQAQQETSKSSLHSLKDYQSNYPHFSQAQYQGNAKQFMNDEVGSMFKPRVELPSQKNQHAHTQNYTAQGQSMNGRLNSSFSTADDIVNQFNSPTSGISAFLHTEQYSKEDLMRRKQVNRILGMPDDTPLRTPNFKNLTGNISTQKDINQLLNSIRKNTSQVESNDANRYKNLFGNSDIKENETKNDNLSNPSPIHSSHSSNHSPSILSHSAQKKFNDLKSREKISINSTNEISQLKIENMQLRSEIVKVNSKTAALESRIDALQQNLESLIHLLFDQQ